MRPAFHFPYHLTDLQAVFEGWTGGGDRIRVSAYSGADVLDFTQLDPEDFPLRIDWDWGNDVVGASWSHPLASGGSLDVTGGPVGLRTGGTLKVAFDADDMRAIEHLYTFHVDLGLPATRITPGEARRMGRRERGDGQRDQRGGEGARDAPRPAG